VRNLIRFLREDVWLALGFVKFSEPAWLFLFADPPAVISTVVGFWPEQVARCCQVKRPKSGVSMPKLTAMGVTVT